MGIWKNRSALSGTELRATSPLLFFQKEIHYGQTLLPNTVFFLQNTGFTVFTSQIILNGMNGESNIVISVRKLNPPCEGDGKRRVSQETVELPMGLNR
jgi:hypothetical protein